ncbi:STAS domain-containing protein [Myxococcus xanthus]|nr:STAS domain-containing protein [Myxococcus xanthus]
MTERLLHRLSQGKARCAIIDITGMVVVDTATANHCIKMVNEARLLGTYCVVTGISPFVAQTPPRLASTSTTEAVKSFTVLLDVLLETMKAQTRDAHGNLTVDVNAWYPLEDDLKAYREIDSLPAPATPQQGAAGRARIPAPISSTGRSALPAALGSAFCLTRGVVRVRVGVNTVRRVLVVALRAPRRVARLFLHVAALSFLRLVWRLGQRPRRFHIWHGDVLLLENIGSRQPCDGRAHMTLHRFLGTARGLLRNAVGIPLTLYRVLRPGKKEAERAQRNAETLIAACRAYQARHGQLPDTLEQLVPEFLPQLPPARFSGPHFGFTYDVSGPADARRHVLGWTDRIPFGRPYFVFEEERWGYLD